MVQVIGIVASIIFGGVSGALLGRWLTRERTTVVMTSIANGRESGEIMEIPDRVISLSEGFHWAQPLEHRSSPELVKHVYQKSKEMRVSYPAILDLITSARKDISRATTPEEKVILAQQICTEPKLRNAVTSGLYRKELTLPSIEQIQKEAPDELCKLIESPIEGGVEVNLDLPQFLTSSKYTGPGWELQKDYALPFLYALQHFHVEALQKSLEYAAKAFENDAIRAEAIIAALENMFKNDPFVVDAVAINNGERVAVVNPYALLVTEGGDRILPPVWLKNADMASEIDVEGAVDESITYIPIPPQSTKVLKFISEQLDNNSQLRSAYDSGVLRCSLVLSKQSGKGKKKVIRSTRRPFGAGLENELKRDLRESRNSPRGYGRTLPASSRSQRSPD
jgi:hypothetical protein